MGFLINQYQGFSGNAVDMASVATQCAQFLQMPGDLEKINERLVRYYVAEGLVERPKRIGRDAEYGYGHLLQFLAGRFLVDAGFPMQKVAPYLDSLEVPQLEALVMNKTKQHADGILVNHPN
jgi:DNA-binding transcriptional MerR regulator